MLTSVKILLISKLFSLLLIGSLGEEGLEISTTQSTAAGLEAMDNESVPLESDANLSSDKENRETSNPKTSNSSFWDLSNKNHGTTEVFGNSSMNNFSGSPRPMPVFPTNPPLIQGFVSKLPQNSSIADENLLPVSAPPSATSVLSSEKFTWSSASDTMKTPDNSSVSMNILPAAPNTTSASPTTTEPDDWLTTTNDSFLGFTPYRETTTLQPTLKFTNNSKIFSNTSDPQEVLRLDNAPEPYDVSFGNSSYYHSTMNDSSMPAGQENARDGIPMDDIPQLRTSV
ncbi:mucin-15 isoform X2 [Suricata suricatta]|uniref:mucin-15 isoform X2 n=1 Tax=Suricata suricatta TaxID=37032 RepID=UPI00115617AD|nr:mucin-15 isoform X2 [Suricata suricatta]